MWAETSTIYLAFFLLQKQKRKCCPLLVCKYPNMDACTHTFNRSFVRIPSNTPCKTVQITQTECNNMWQHSWHIFLSMVCAKTLKLNPPTSTKGRTWKISFCTDRETWPLLSSLHSTQYLIYLCTSVKKWLLFEFLSISQHRVLRPRHPHRKKINPSIADDIIKLLNEIAVPVQAGPFSRMGLYNKNALLANAHAV